MPTNKFTAETIAALLREAYKGGTNKDVAEHAGISEAALSNWVTRGRKENKEGRVSGYSRFATKWGEIRVGHERVGSIDTMAEMDRALEMLADSNEEA